MDLFKIWQGIRYIIHLFIMNLVFCLVWLPGIVLGQVAASGTLSSIVNFPDVGLACGMHFGILIKTLVSGGLDWEVGAKDVLAILTGRKLRQIEGFDVGKCFALTTCGETLEPNIVMLSHKTPNCSMKQFVEYIANVCNVQSVLLQCFPLRDLSDPDDRWKCNCTDCKCVYFYTGRCEGAKVTESLAPQIRRPSDDVCVLPCATCLTPGCRRFNSTTTSDRDPAAAAFKSLDSTEAGSCICISLTLTDRDKLTGLVTAGSEKCAANGKCPVTRDYKDECVIFPRITEIFVNFVLTFVFKVDGFSSALVARTFFRTIMGKVEKSCSPAFAASVFMTKAEVSTNTCQVLCFKTNFWTFKTYTSIVYCSNLICSVGWAVLVALEVGTDKWYHPPSPPPSKLKDYVLMASIVIALGMDMIDVFALGRDITCNDFLGRDITCNDFLGRDITCNDFLGREPFCKPVSQKIPSSLAYVMIIEIGCIVAIGITLGKEVVGRWIYSVMQCLVWLKWGVGSYLLYQNSEKPRMYSYSSAFLLNFILAFVRTKWGKEDS